MRMYRRVVFPVLAAAVILSARPAAAQDDGIGFGVEAGFVRSTLADEDAEDIIGGFNAEKGWMAGIWFGGNRNGILGFMGEIAYVRKGASGGAGHDEIKLNYLEIPALVRVNLGQTGNRNGFLIYPFAGPVFDIQLTAEDANGDDIKDAFNGFDLGVMAGVGVEIARIGFEVRGNWGMTGVAKDEEGTGFTVIKDAKNRVLQALVKIRLN